MGAAIVEVFLTDDDTSLRNALAVFYPDDTNQSNKELRQEFMANWTKAS
jgi:hypothetical protein